MSLLSGIYREYTYVCMTCKFLIQCLAHSKYSISVNYIIYKYIFNHIHRLQATNQYFIIKCNFIHLLIHSQKVYATLFSSQVISQRGFSFCFKVSKEEDYLASKTTNSLNSALLWPRVKWWDLTEQETHEAKLTVLLSIHHHCYSSEFYQCSWSVKLNLKHDQMNSATWRPQ